jgi:hypothetical protein
VYMFFVFTATNLKICTIKVVRGCYADSHDNGGKKTG